MKFTRLSGNPIIYPELAPEIGHNINGPSLIRTPDWLPDPMGAYYLYFGHHNGLNIRLAYADDLAGPWTIYRAGTLQLEQTPCFRHIASPDVHVDNERRRIIMYYHGPVLEEAAAAADPLTIRYPYLGGQRSLAAISGDGINFVSGQEILGPSYLRAFRWQGMIYSMCMPGIFYRSRDGLTDFEQGPTLFDQDLRHFALHVQGDMLNLFYSQVGDSPEHIRLARIELKPDWNQWAVSDIRSILRPELDYEGGDLPLEPSQRGAVNRPVRQLRDPAIYEENDRLYLLYSVAGEQGLAIAVNVDV
jgi:hypothetical protein